MKSRERVRMAVSFEQTDRPPLDCTMTIDAYNNLIEYLQLNVPRAQDCTLFMTVQIDPRVISAMRLDLGYVGLSPRASLPPLRYHDRNYTDQWGLIYHRTVQPTGIVNFQIVNEPLAGTSIKDLERYPWPDPDDPSLYTGLRERAQRLHAEDLAVVGNFGGSIFTLASLLRGMERWFMDLLLDPEYAERLIGILSDYHRRVTTNAIALAGDCLDIVRTDNDDYGTQGGLLISPDLFRSVVKPQLRGYYESIAGALHAENPAGTLMKHSCGAVAELVDEFIDLGINILDPMQVAAAGMDAGKLARRFGGRIAFHGGVDTQHLLPHGTAEEVTAATRRLSACFRERGGLIVCPVHHVEPDVPPVNLVAMRDALQQTSV